MEFAKDNDELDLLSQSVNASYATWKDQIRHVNILKIRCLCFWDGVRLPVQFGVDTTNN